MGWNEGNEVGVSCKFGAGNSVHPICSACITTSQRTETGTTYNFFTALGNIEREEEHVNITSMKTEERTYPASSEIVLRETPKDPLTTSNIGAVSMAGQNRDEGTTMRQGGDSDGY